MIENEALYQVNRNTGEFSELSPASAWELDLKEKEIEKWVVRNPKILFSDPDAITIIAQELSGEVLADVLAVDSQGNLIVVEIKRHWSDRNVVGQILDYAARLSEWVYEQFNERWNTGGHEKDLFKAFKVFIQNDSFSREDFLKNRRLFILAAGEDEGMKRIISWLRDGYKVPIDFIPFSLYKAGNETYVRIGKIDVMPIVSNAEWRGDWFFNSAETYAPNAFQSMIDLATIAAFGYGPERTEHKMNLPAQGERVFMFVTGRGIIAVGRVLEDQAVQRDTVFGNRDGDEYHREVRWSYSVAPDEAVTASQCSDWGYNLPVRCVIARIANHHVADLIERTLKERIEQHNTQQNEK